jgi:hypothetical protein
MIKRRRRRRRFSERAAAQGHAEASEAASEAVDTLWADVATALADATRRHAPATNVALARAAYYVAATRAQKPRLDACTPRRDRGRSRGRRTGFAVRRASTQARRTSSGPREWLRTTSSRSLAVPQRFESKHRRLRGTRRTTRRTTRISRGF